MLPPREMSELRYLPWEGQYPEGKKRVWRGKEGEQKLKKKGRHEKTEEERERRKETQEKMKEKEMPARRLLCASTVLRDLHVTSTPHEQGL